MRLTNTWKLACVFIIFLLVILLVDASKNDKENDKKVKPKGKPTKPTSSNKSASEKEKNVKKKQKEKSKDSEESDDEEQEKNSQVFVPKESPKITVDLPTIVAEGSASSMQLNVTQVYISSPQLASDSTVSTSLLNLTNYTPSALNSTLNISLVNSSLANQTLNDTLFGSEGNISNSTTGSRCPHWSDYHRYHGYHRFHGNSTAESRCPHNVSDYHRYHGYHGFHGDSSAQSKCPHYSSDYHRYHGYHGFHGSRYGGSTTKDPQLEKVEKELSELWAYVQGMSQPVHVHVYNSENAYKSQGAEKPEAGKRREHIEPEDTNHTHDHSHNDTHSHNHTHSHTHSKYHHHIGKDHDHKHAHHHGGARDYHHLHAHQHHEHAHHDHDHAHPKDTEQDYHHGHPHQHGHEKDVKDKARPYLRPDFPKRETHVHIHIGQSSQREEHVGKEGHPHVHAHEGDHNHADDHKHETQKEYKPLSARCDLQTFTNGSNISGVVFFNQKSVDELVVDVKIKGIPVIERTLNETSNMTTASSLHGFHVHEFGDLSSGCTSLGGHFNPEGVDHGLRNHQVHGHVGDWGNLEADSEGRVDKQFSVTAASLSGPHSILGRGIVLHAQRDDLGLGGSAASKTTGDAGGRIACCVIVATKPSN